MLLRHFWAWDLVLSFVIRASSLFPAYVRPMFHAANLATGVCRRYSPKTCVGLSDTLGALKRRPFYSTDCVVLNIEATTQPVSPSSTGAVWKGANVRAGSPPSHNPSTR